MYLAMIILLMVVLPIGSILVEILVGGSATLTAALVGKWFVFWALGIRLLLAGLRQILQPRYTAETILGIQGEDALLLVRELGFSNAAIGAAATASLFMSGWALPLALVGTIFYGLAGLNHLRQGERNRLENIAMLSDLFIGLVLLIVCLAALF